MNDSKVLKICRTLPDLKSSGVCSVVAVGNFDGVHLGHQYLLRKVVKKAKELESAGAGKVLPVVVSFYPHPARVLKGLKTLPVLTTLRQKAAYLSGLGIRALYLIRFTPSFADVRADEFIDTILIERLNVAYMVLGPDTALGRDREGDCSFIAGRLAGAEIGSEVIDPLEIKGVKASSGVVRSCLAVGDVEGAAVYLGRPYEIAGRVVAGAGRGKKLQIPTINLNPGVQMAPSKGVYASKVVIDGKSYLSATNVGVRPTFGGTNLVIESHLLNFPDKNLYGKRLSIRLHTRIRDEIAFDSKTDLKAQIQLDLAAAKKHFEDIEWT